MAEQDDLHVQVRQFLERGHVVTVAREKFRVNPDVAVGHARGLAADEGLDAREVEGEAVTGVSRRGDDAEGPSAAQVDRLAVLEDAVHLEGVEADVLVPEKRLVLLLVVAAEAADQVDGVGFLDDIGGHAACGHLEAGDAALEIGGRPGVIEVGVRDEDPAQAFLVAEVPADLADVGGAHEGDAGVEKRRGFGRHEPRGQVDVCKRVEPLDDSSGLLDDHGLRVPPTNRSAC